MTLFHGSYLEVSAPDVKRGREAGEAFQLVYRSAGVSQTAS